MTAPDTTPDRLRQACGNGPVCDDFVTPSGNIRCFAADQNGGFVECDIHSGLNPAPKHGNCDLDQPGLSVGANGAASVSCRSDPTPAGFDHAIPPLAYGDTLERVRRRLRQPRDRHHLHQRGRPRLLPVARELANVLDTA